MTRIDGRWTRFIAATILLLLSCGREKSPKRYNLLLITIDTIRADRVGAYGDSAAKTPVMDRLAREGVRFENAIAAAPLTLPSHATILTGLLPPQHGLRNNGAGRLTADTPTLATKLSAAGYRTGAFVGAFVLDRRFGLNRGFDEYDDDIPGARAENVRLEAERPATAVVDRAIAWMRKADARPMFAWVHLYDPHAPYSPPAPYRDWFPDDPYRGEVAFVDHQMGRLLGGISEPTVILIVGDHGEALGGHGEGTHGLLLYEPTLRVPLILRAPALKPRVVKTTFSLADVASMLSSLLGVEQSSFRDDELEEKVIYSETEYPTLFGWSSIAAVRGGAFKYIDSPAPELYNLTNDPNETKNLYGTERRALRPLAEALTSLRVPSKPSTSVQLDPETQRKLASLGYVAPSSPVRSGQAADPKEMVGLFRRFEQAIWDLHGGHPRQALEELESLVRADENNPVFRSSLARAHREHGRLERAIELYREAVALRPDDAEGWYNLAATFQEAGDQKRAAEAIGEAIRRDPTRPEAHNVLGIAYSAAGDPQRALEQFRRAAELDPRNARAVNNMGNALRSMRRFDEAAAAYQRAIQLDFGYADPWNGLGAIEVERGKPNAAIQFFERALRLSPEIHEARLNMAVAYQLSGDLASAARQYRAFINAVEDNPAFKAQRRDARAMLARITSRKTTS